MKTLRFFLTTMLLLTCNMMYAFKVDGIYYNITSTTDKTVAVTFQNSNYNSYSGDIVIPETIEYNGTVYSVTMISDKAFQSCSSLTSIELPAGLTSIGSYAFQSCSSLTSIELPASVTSIGNETFKSCSSLTSIELPSGLTSIGSSAFNGCSSLTSIELPSELTSIGSSAFQSCSSLTSIELPAGLTSIESSAFRSCSSLTSIGLPAGLTSIGSYAFESCSSLTSIELPSGLTSIGSNAFQNCSSLTSIKLPAGVTSIGANVFSGCDDLAKIYLLSEELFSYANISGYSRAIIVPESAVETYRQAEGWRDIAKYITGTERMIKSIEVTASNTGSSVRNTITEELLGEVVDLTIKGTINSYDIIVLNQKMPLLQNLDLSEASIVACDYPYYNSYCTQDNTIGHYMFYGTTLRNISLPKNIRGEIGIYAFSACRYMRSINIPEGVVGISSYAFKADVTGNKCGLKSVTLPSSLKK